MVVFQVSPSTRYKKQAYIREILSLIQLPEQARSNLALCTDAVHEASNEIKQFSQKFSGLIRKFEKNKNTLDTLLCLSAVTRENTISVCHLWVDNWLI